MSTTEQTASLFMVVARVGETARANIEKVRSLLPQERRRTAQLLREGRIASAYLDLGGSAVFFLIPGPDDEAIRNTLSEFPLYDYFEWELYPVREGIPDEA